MINVRQRAHSERAGVAREREAADAVRFGSGVADYSCNEARLHENGYATCRADTNLPQAPTCKSIEQG